MHYIQNINFKTLKYDLTNKFFYKTTKSIPQIKKIILNFGCNTTDIKILSSSLLALELIVFKKGKLTITKKPNVILKIRKGNPIGCKVILRKKKILWFLEKILTNIFPHIKNFTGLVANCNKNAFSYKLTNPLSFKELANHYYLFNNVPNLNITILTNSNNKKELLFILKSIQFPVKLEKVSKL